mgnify:CR=1 FL=1
MKILLLSQKVFTEKQKLKLKRLLNNFAKKIRLIIAFSDILTLQAQAPLEKLD